MSKSKPLSSIPLLTKLQVKLTTTTQVYLDVTILFNVSGFEESIFPSFQTEKEEKKKLQSYLAARTIQRYFRGLLVRKHIKMLHFKTTIIQKHWRGVLGRKLYYQLLKETVQKRCMEKFNKCATTIQKVWRGYLARKFIFDYNLFKEWMENVMQANKNIVERIEKERTSDQESNELATEEEAKKNLHCVLLKSHHLLRTFHRKGVLSRKEDTREYSFTEELMRSFNFMSYLKKQKQDEAKRYKIKIKDDEMTEDIEFTLEKIKKLKRDCALQRAKEREKSEPKNQLRTQKIIKKRIQNISSKKQTEECKCCAIPNYRNY
ncbi:spermatogenesis-associated protein 17-like [Nilaparvata lugens]|uniref:spermatogenesis-associated protein 17-like n=1 Tax=Nilaparvata lugens TaxID=108931 RepID=UPI00193E3438|nr:spermatogenesis-associated protein 17-like [Nilaparvata lugens]